VYEVGSPNLNMRFACKITQRDFTVRSMFQAKYRETQKLSLL